MSLSTNLTGKMFLTSLALYLGARVYKKHVLDAEEPQDPHLGLSEGMYNTLSSLVFNDDRRGFTATLDAAGAPSDMNFRRQLWKALGG